MSIFGRIMNSIFGQSAAAQTVTPEPSATPGAPPSATPSAAPSSAPAAPPPGQPVDVAKVLDDLAAKNKEKLDWRRSIVDLMKLLDIDASLSARKELAKELNYTGDTNDSATMNVWLHKQVIRKLEENGGKVPADLKD